MVLRFRRRGDWEGFIIGVRGKLGDFVIRRKGGSCYRIKGYWDKNSRMLIIIEI